MNRPYDNLYGGKPPHQVHSDTSEAAADEIADVALCVRERVYEYIKSQGEHGATDDEIHDFFQIDKNTTAPRRRELQLKGLVIDSGNRRQTKAKRWAVVWVAASFAGVVPGPRKSTKQRLVEAEAENTRLRAENTRLRMRLLGKKRQMTLDLGGKDE